MRKKTFRFVWAKEILESHLASRILGGWHAGPEQAAVHMARWIRAIALAQKILGLHFLSLRNLAWLKGLCWEETTKQFQWRMCSS
jgi:hypothetical protein